MEYSVIRSKRKTVSLSVARTGDVIVRAPLRMKDGEIEAFVARHRRWLEKRLASRPSSLPTLGDGDVLPLFGERYTVAAGRARFDGGVLYLPGEGREEALASLLKRASRARMAQMTREVAERGGFRYSDVRISSARSRWGSCSKKGRISYTYRTACLPDALAEYIVVHELCHTRVFSHSPAFWREVENILPDYAARRRALRAYEWAMEWI